MVGLVDEFERRGVPSFGPERAASKGYPGRYATGFTIEGIETVNMEGNVVTFLAGVGKTPGVSGVPEAPENAATSGGDVSSGRTAGYVTTGGRVCAVLARGSTIEEVRNAAYRTLDRITFRGMYFRRDIGAPS